MSIEGTSDKRRITLSAMRKMLVFLKAHPEVPLPRFEFTEWVWSKAELITKSRRLGSVVKEIGSSTYTLAKRFSEEVALKVSCYQSTVCEKKVVGQKLVARVPAHPAVEEHFEDVYEYECGPLGETPK